MASVNVNLANIGDQYKATHFSTHIFWDVAVNEIDLENHALFVFERVMRYGQIKDWILLKKIYGLSKIKRLAIEVRDLDDFSIAYLSLILNVKKESFRCYKKKQSLPSFWNY